MAEAPRRYQVTCGTGVRLELIGSLRSAGAWRGVNHRHAFWELLWYRDSSGEFRCGGRRYDVHDGRCFLVPPGMHHQLAIEHGFKHLYVGFTWTGRTPTAQRLAALPELPPALAVALDREFNATWERCSGAVERLDAGVEFLPRLLELARWLQEGGATDPGDAHQASVHQAKAYLTANLHRTVTVREVAASCYLSPGYLGEVFGRATGCTIKAWHAELRLQRAAELLRQSGADINEIARLLGFEQPAYFTRLFTRRFGSPPSRYRAEGPSTDAPTG